MQSLGELTTLYPSGGAFTSLADRFVDPAFGVAVGWNYVSADLPYPHLRHMRFSPLALCGGQVKRIKQGTARVLTHNFHQFIIWLAVLANEYNAVTSILVFWSDKVPLWGYFLLLWVSSPLCNVYLFREACSTRLLIPSQSAFLAFQLLGVETFGEAEFWLALIKLLSLCAYYIFAIVQVSLSPATLFLYAPLLTSRE